jgi:parvulin-like peptidyl-prolyl isomerase
MKIKHILVSHEYEAKDILRKLNEGDPFEKLAKAFSSCSSAADGGDLGDLSGKLKRLHPDFAEAAQSLQIGQVSETVKTSFGYHLIYRY